MNKQQSKKQSKKQSKPLKIQVQKTKKDWFTSKVLYWAGLIVVSIVYFSIYAKCFDYKIDMNGDNIHYYALGNALADGKGFVSPIGYVEVPHNHYPVGYPVIISIAVSLGAGIVGIKILNGILLWLSCLILYHLFFRLSKNVFITFAVVLLCVTNNLLLRYATMMMSEVPYLFFTSLVLLMFSYLVEQKKFGRKFWCLLVGIGICSVFSYFIRTVGLALIVALLVATATLILINVFKNKKESLKFHWQTNRMLVVTIAVIGVIFLIGKGSWDLRNSKYGYKSSYMAQLSVQSGGEQIKDFSGWVNRVTENSTRYITKEIASGVFARDFDYTEKATDGDWFWGLFFLAFVTVGFFQLTKENMLLFYYAGATAAILLLWPGIWYGPRFMLPIIPLLLFFFVTGIVTALAFLLKSLKIPSTVLVPASLIIILLVMIPKYNTANSKMSALARHKTFMATNTAPQALEFIQATQWIKANIADTARIASRKPEIFYIFSDKRKCGGFPSYATPEEVLEHFEKNKVDYLIVDRWFGTAYNYIVPCMQKYPEKFRIVRQIGGANNQPATYVAQFLR